jgi:thiosulfate/3-mercaptopyruvate sulfurtransferase
VAVVDGGLAKWTAERQPLSTAPARREPVEFQPAPRAGMTVSAGEVDACRLDPAWRVVDGRAPERYRGEVEPMDPVAGHIPGAISHFFQQNLDERGLVRAPEDLRSRWRAMLGDVPPERVVCYCGSGVQASQNLLALEHAGISGAKLYPGSWSEWVSDRTRAVETTAGAPEQNNKS